MKLFMYAFITGCCEMTKKILLHYYDDVDDVNGCYLVNIYHSIYRFLLIEVEKYGCARICTPFFARFSKCCE